STTCALVGTMPEGSTITPEPRLFCTCSRSGTSPKKRRKNSSPKNSSMGVRPAAPRVTVLMLTTAGATVSATWEKLPEGTGSAAGTIGPCTPIRVGFGYGGVARSTAPAPHVPRPAPAEGHGSELLGHAVLHHHQPGHLGGAFEVVVGARGDLSVDDLFGRPPAQQDRDAVLQLAPGEEIAVLERELIGGAQRAHAA